MRKRRFEILLPLRFNDGQPIPSDRYDQTREELVAHFGSVTVEPGTVRGVWVHQGTRYEDELRRLVLDVEDTPENQAFFSSLQPILRQRFEQLEIYIASFPVDIV